MSLANTHAAVVEHLIIFADRFFPGEVSGFNICFCRGTATSKFVFFFCRSIFMRPTLSPCTLVYFNHLRLWTGDLSIEVNCFFCRVSKLKPCLNLGGFSCRRTCRNFQRREADAPTHGKHRRVSWASPSGHARQLCIRQVRVTKLAQTVSFFQRFQCVTINLFVAQRKLKGIEQQGNVQKLPKRKRAYQHYRFALSAMTDGIALCWANFRLRLPLKTASRQSPADRRAHPGHQESANSDSLAWSKAKDWEIRTCNLASKLCCVNHITSLTTHEERDFLMGL